MKLQSETGPPQYQWCPACKGKSYSLLQIRQELDPNSRTFTCITCNKVIAVDERMTLVLPDRLARSASSRRRRLSALSKSNGTLLPDTSDEADTIPLADALQMSGKVAEDAFKHACNDARLRWTVQMGRKPVLFDRFRVFELLGSGANSIVVAAQDLQHKKQVALKLTPATSVNSDDGRLAARRVRRAFEIQRRLSNLESVPEVYELIEDPEYGLVVIEQQAMGIPLKSVLEASRTLTEESAIKIGVQLLTVIVVAEQHGIVHRDIKPANVMILLENLKAVLIDFGEARCNKTDGPSPYRLLEAASLQDADAEKVLETLTQEGEGFGTLHYMAPEQADGARVDSKTDVYGVAATLYHVVTGHPPLVGMNLQDHISLIKAKDPKPAILATNGGVTKGFSDVLSEAMSKDPARRPSPNQMITDLLTRRSRRQQNGAAGVFGWFKSLFRTGQAGA